MKRLLALAVLVVAALGACSFPFPAGGITREQAIALAQAHISDMSFQDASVGPHRTFTERGDPNTSDRLVWAVRFSGDVTICSPVGTCWSPRPATTTVILDFRTGEFLESSGFSPSSK
jgi:hypothetical protein